MQHQNRPLLFALACLALTACQSAGAPKADSPTRGVYAKVLAGAGVLQDEDVVFTEGGGGSVTGDGSFDAGFLTGAAVGYRLDENWAAEVEFTYRTNDVDTFASGGSNLADAGDFASTALMLNGFYHSTTGWAIEPYVGIGFGTATEIDIDLAGGTSFRGGRSFSGSSPAAQFMVGGTGRLTDELDYFIEGRFLRAFDPDLDEEGGGGNVESEYGHFGLLFGLSYGF